MQQKIKNGLHTRSFRLCDFNNNFSSQSAITWKSTKSDSVGLICSVNLRRWPLLLVLSCPTEQSPRKKRKPASSTNSTKASWRVDGVPTCGVDHSVGSHEYFYRMVHIWGPSIQYTHFLDRADLPALIQLGVNRKRAIQNKYKRGIRSKR